MKDLAATANIHQATKSDKKLAAQLAKLARANDAAQEALRLLLAQAQSKAETLAVLPGRQAVLQAALAVKAKGLLTSRRVRGRLVRLVEVSASFFFN